MKNEDKTTDPASEIADLFAEFSTIVPDHRDDNTQDVLSSYFKCDPSTPDWYELVGTIASRIRSLREFISSVEDRFVKDKMREQTLKSLDHMTQFVSPSRMAQNWNSVKVALFTDDHIGRLESFASTAEKYKPLRKLNDDERQEIVEKIDAVLQQISADQTQFSEIPEWALAPVVEGIQDLRRIILHLRFFGHQAAIDAILNLSIKLDGIAASGLPSEHKKSVFELVRNTMHIVFFVGEALLLPANAYQGYHVYKDVTLEYIINQKDNKHSLVDDNANQKALPAPDDRASKEKEGIAVAP